ncbi:Oidioi.mRNA.OKI2018_I69.PAR.g10264.t1.cds [Oikopleura dioica]|uniref:Complex I intermediate-associated protein 30, mitochondrial n=1 Tax=Oikopleura dioica TaxID=34765 RepID=A0ABN7RVK7_OIKDI|nr:Oidioi.mRNA.OKI2018_I69.PAR.g10264.t1.cds [Oikopleura dioica]
MNFNFLENTWFAVNDTVMLGSSVGYVEKMDKMLKFYGKLSDHFFGGFASCQTQFEPGTFAGFDGIEMSVRGSENRNFQARFYPVQTDMTMSYAKGSYIANFKAKKDWTTVKIPFDSAEFFWRGRKVSKIPPIDPSQLKGIGFLISDKIFDSSFELFVESISGYKNE